MAVAVCSAVEVAVHPADSERIDRGAPVELAVVGAGVHGVETRVDRVGVGSHRCVGVDARQDGEAPARGPQRREHREHREADGECTAGDGDKAGAARPVQHESAW